MKGPRLAIHLCSLAQALVPAAVVSALYLTARVTPGTLGGMAIAGAAAVLAVEIFHPLALPFFVGGLGWNFYQTLMIGGLDESVPLAVICIAIVLQGLNAIVLGSFLARTLYVAYGNPQQRWWWEEDPRYRVKLPVQIGFNGESNYGRILDISRGGVLIDTGRKGWLSAGDVVELSFQFHDLRIKVRARAIHHGSADRNLCGMSFHRPSWSVRRRIRNLVWVFRFLGFERRISSASWLVELVQAFRKDSPNPPRIAQLDASESDSEGSSPRDAA